MPKWTEEEDPAPLPQVVQDWLKDRSGRSKTKKPAKDDRSRTPRRRRRAREPSRTGTSPGSESDRLSMKSIKPKEKAKRKDSGPREEGTKADRRPKVAKVKEELSEEEEQEEESDCPYPSHGYFFSKVKGRKGVALCVKHKELDEIVELEDGIDWKLKDRKSGSEVFDADCPANSQTCQELFQLVHTEMKAPSKSEKKPKGRIMH